MKSAWLAEQKMLAWNKAYKEMRTKYTVYLPRTPENANSAPAQSVKGTTPTTGTTNGRMQ